MALVGTSNFAIQLLMTVSGVNSYWLLNFPLVAAEELVGSRTVFHSFWSESEIKECVYRRRDADMYDTDKNFMSMFHVESSLSSYRVTVASCRAVSIWSDRSVSAKGDSPVN